jgi:Thioredoxin like C-terminal domain
MEEQAATLNAADGRIAYRFHARDLHLVMGQAGPISDRTFEITFLDAGVQAYAFTFG